LQAIESLPADEVILLPNNSNVIMAAQQAKDLAGDRLGKRVEVVPSRTVPQGISAFLATNQQAALESNVAAMTRALDTIDTGEITTAVRDASFDGVDVRTGDIIGLLNDKLTSKAERPEDVAMMLLAQMNASEAEIITVYYGDQVDPGSAQSLGELIAEAYPEQVTEVLSGGQPHYFYIISAE
jgi:hypothetical protein